jgi:hypothetical protein
MGRFSNLKMPADKDFFGKKRRPMNEAPGRPTEESLGDIGISAY